jgi:hypothetical protein
VRRALARALRRWADSILPEENNAQKPAFEKSLEGIHAKKTAEEEGTPAVGHPPGSREATHRKPGEPPEHWAELVRRAAPDLLRPARERMIAYRAVPPPDVSSSKADPVRIAADREPESKAHEIPPMREVQALFSPNAQPAGGVGSETPSGRTGENSSRSFSSPDLPELGLARPPEESHRRAETRPHPDSSSATRDSGALQGSPTVLESAIQQKSFASPETAIQSGLRQPKADYSLRPKSPSPCHSEKRSDEVRFQDSGGAHRTPETGESALEGEEKQIPRYARNDRAGETFIHMGGPKAYATLGMTGHPEVSEQRAGSQLSEQSEQRWPELPLEPSPMPARPSVRVMPFETDPQISTEETKSTMGCSGRAAGRWPELLQEPSWNVEEWEEALRARERVSRLDVEQRGGR